MQHATVVALYEQDRYRFTELMREFASMGFVWVNSMRDKSSGLLGHFISVVKAK